MDLAQQRELQRAITGPVSASIQTMNHASFLVFDDIPPSDDSDEEDLDRYIDVGLREQLFITLSRAIRSVQNAEQKITESSVPETTQNKRGSQMNRKQHKPKHKNKNRNRNKNKRKNHRHFKQTKTAPTLPLSRYTIAQPPPHKRKPHKRPTTSVTPTLSPKDHHLNMPLPLSMNNKTRRGAIYVQRSSKSQPVSPIKPIQRRITMQIPPPPVTPPPPVPIRYKHIPSRTTIAMPSKPVPKKALPPLIRSRTRPKQTTRQRARSRSKDHIDHMTLHHVQQNIVYKPQKTQIKQIALRKNVPPSKNIPDPPQKLWRRIKNESKYNRMIHPSLHHSISSSSHDTVTSSQSSHSSNSFNSSHSSNYARNRNETIALYSSYQPASPPSPPTIACSAPADSNAFTPPSSSFVFPAAAPTKQIKKRRPGTPMQVYSQLPMRNKLDAIHMKPIQTEPEALPSLPHNFFSHTNVRSDTPPVPPTTLNSHFKSRTLNSLTPQKMALKITVSDDICATEHVLADPTLDPKRNMKYEMNKNPLRFIRPRGATWIGNIAHMNELSPSTTAPAMCTKVDRTDSLAAGFEGATMKDGHIVLKQSDSKSHLDIDQKELRRQFKKGFPDFVHLHQRFSQEFANKIFNGQLKSYQRAFIPISPEHLGLMDFSNIRSRRRALFGGDKLAHKPFNDRDADTAMNITDEERNRAIDKYMNNEKGATNKLKKLVAPMLSSAAQSYSESRTNAWQKLLHKIRNRQGNHINVRKEKKTSFTLDDPRDIRRVNHPLRNSVYNVSNKAKDDMLMQYNHGDDDDDDSLYKTEFGVHQINNSVEAKQIKRGDVIFIIEHQHIDVENLDLNSFVTKYKMQNFLKRMAEDSKHREDQMRTIRERSTRRLLMTPTVYTINRLGKINELYTTNEELEDIQLLQELQNIQSSKHCMIVLQNIGSSIEIAHVTSHGGIRSFMTEFDAEKIAHHIYCKGKSMGKRPRATSTHIVEALGRGPPVAYRCVVYRLSASVLHNKTFANEAANVAENLVKCGRVLSDPAVFHPHAAGAASDIDSRRRNRTNPEKYFYRFLLNSDSSLFRRTARLQFDEGTNFFNFSSSEFVALCYQRALVNKRSFDRELIRLLDFCPHVTPASLLQKYIHLNIDEHRDWECLGVTFFSYL